MGSARKSRIDRQTNFVGVDLVSALALCKTKYRFIKNKGGHSGPPYR
jgi:hypothetical protein